VGEGRLKWNSPLVDPVRLIPYSQVAPEAITALDSEGVDTTAYRASAQAIYNSGVIVGGNVASSTLDVRNGG
jgi:hypothetical protein